MSVTHNQWHRWSFNARDGAWYCQDCPVSVPYGAIGHPDTWPDGADLSERATRALDRAVTERQRGAKR